MKKVVQNTPFLYRFTTCSYLRIYAYQILYTCFNTAFIYIIDLDDETSAILLTCKWKQDHILGRNTHDYYRHILRYTLFTFYLITDGHHKSKLWLHSAYLRYTPTYIINYVKCVGEDINVFTKINGYRR